MFLKAKITTLTDERVTLELEDGQVLSLPVAAVEGQPKQGMDVSLIATALGAEDAGRQAIARDLLNTLLSA